MKGKTPADLNGEGQQLAEHMGYHWAKNTDPDVPFNGFMYHGDRMIAVKLMKVRYSPGEDCIIERKYPEAVDELRTLPVPLHVIRELWLRTQNERMYRRFLILPDTTAEIEENTGEGYRNPHFREMYWKNAPNRIDIPLHKGGGSGGMKSDKPKMGSDRQIDDSHFWPEWNLCPRPWRIGRNGVYS